MRDPAVVVVGSCNEDVVVPVERLPVPGQTVLGGDRARFPGGKGANQAVAAARLGCDVTLVGRVGDDEPGRSMLAALAAEGVAVGHVPTTAGVPSGAAFIAVDGVGENLIVVSPGANARLTPADVAAAEPLLSVADVLLCQLEVPVECVRRAAGLARAGRARVLLNPAPAVRLDRDLLDQVDVLVPNRTELGLLTGRPAPVTLDEALAAARLLPGLDVVVTLGGDGALVVGRDGSAQHVPAAAVDAVDTVGAGDAFCAGLADALARGATLPEAVQWAVAVAGLATTRRGAQPAMPGREEVAGHTGRAPGGRRP
ncbi:ribokinase [Motilibacter aurantiacus]|uniref:ribokinase n=1 Tax=Motilibacter aurantiacus TaxID=2714955 RepID=UPI0014086E6D|nr:ribokinase [Motilibacter aurantiacus]